MERSTSRKIFPCPRQRAVKGLPLRIMVIMLSEAFQSGPTRDFAVTGILSICRRLENIKKRMLNEAPRHDLITELRHCFEALDRIIVHTPPESAEALLQDPEVRRCREHVQQLRARHECIEEEATAVRILSSSDPARDIDDYMAKRYPITAIHTGRFKAQMRGKTACLLIGSGAFPSTALLLLEQTGLALCCIDHVERCCQLGERIIRASKKGKTVFACADAMHLDDFSDWDVVFVSVLAGVEMGVSVKSRRNALIDRLLRHVRPGTLLVLRSACGLAGLIYPSIDQKQIKNRKVLEIAAPAPGRSSLVLVEA